MSSERIPQSIQSGRSVAYDLMVIGGGLQAYLLAEAAAKCYARVALVASPRLMEMATYHTDRLQNWVETLTIAGVDVLLGGGEFTSKQSFLWQGKELKSRSFVLAIPPQHSPLKIHGLAAVPYVTSEDFFKIERIPHSIIIIGGDALSCSIAQNLGQAGTKVTILVPGNHILPEVDVEIVRMLQARLEIDGIDIFTNTSPSAVDVLEDGTIKLWNSSQSLLCQSLFLPLVMEEYLTALNLIAARVKSENGVIIQNQRRQTTNPRIYLCHSLADIPLLLQNILFLPIVRQAPKTPIIVNTSPEIAALGITETAARRRFGKQLRVLRQPLLPMGLCKILCLPNGKIIGAHLMGDRAKEVMEAIALAVEMQLTLPQLARHRFPLASILTEIAEIFVEQQRERDIAGRIRLVRWFAFRREWNL